MFCVRFFCPSVLCTPLFFFVLLSLCEIKVSGFLEWDRIYFLMVDRRFCCGWPMFFTDGFFYVNSGWSLWDTSAVYVLYQKRFKNKGAMIRIYVQVCLFLVLILNFNCPFWWQTVKGFFDFWVEWCFFYKN